MSNKPTSGKWQYRDGNTYFDKLGKMYTGDMIYDKDWRWLATVWQDEIGVDEQEANGKLIETSVNACKDINPTNPQTVAESIKFMYQALQRSYETLNDLIDSKQIKNPGGAYKTIGTRHYIKDCLSQLKKQ